MGFILGTNVLGFLFLKAHAGGCGAKGPGVGDLGRGHNSHLGK